MSLNIKNQKQGKLFKQLGTLNILEKQQLKMNQDYEVLHREGQNNIRTINSYRKRDLREPLAYVKSYHQPGKE